MQIPGSSKSLSDWSFLQCSHVKNFPNFSHRFFGKVGLFPSEQKNFQVENSGKFQISNDCNQTMGVWTNIPRRIFGGSWLAKEKKTHKTPQKYVALTQLEVFQCFCWPHLLGDRVYHGKKERKCMKKITSTTLDDKNRLLVKSNMKSWHFA